MRYGRIFLFLAITALSCLLQLTGSIWGIPFDLGLAALIAISFFGTFTETVVSSVAAVLLLQWRPGFSIELLLIFAIPVLTHVLKLVFPWRRWFGFVLLSLLSIIGFNMEIGGLNVLFSGTLIVDVLISLSYGLIIFALLMGMYDSKSHEFGFRR